MDQTLHRVATTEREAIKEIIMIIIMMIALKDAIQDFHNLLTAPRTVSDTYAGAVV